MAQKGRRRHRGNGSFPTRGLRILKPRRASRVTPPHRCERITLRTIGAREERILSLTWCSGQGDQARVVHPLDGGTHLAPGPPRTRLDHPGERATGRLPWRVACLKPRQAVTGSDRRGGGPSRRHPRSPHRSKPGASPPHAGRSESCRMGAARGRPNPGRGAQPRSPSDSAPSHCHLRHDGARIGVAVRVRHQRNHPAEPLYRAGPCGGTYQPGPGSTACLAVAPY